MSALLNMIVTLTRLGVLLFMVGRIQEAVDFFKVEVARNHQRGLSSTTDLNYQLMGPQKFCESIAWPDKRCPKSLEKPLNR